MPLVTVIIQRAALQALIVRHSGFLSTDRNALLCEPAHACRVGGDRPAHRCDRLARVLPASR